MDTLFFTLAAFGSAVLVMSVGILFKRKPIQGSCGGIANMMGACDICDKVSECEDMKEYKLLNKCIPEDCSKDH